MKILAYYTLGIDIQNTPKLTKNSVKKSGVPFLKSNLYEERNTFLRYCHY